MAEDEKAVEAESSTSSDSKATETVEGTESPKDGKGNTVPYDRFKEVVAQKNEFSEKYEALEKQFADRQSELGQMIELLNAREDDAKIVSAIRQLGANPEHKELVERLDNLLQGKEVEEEKAPEGEQSDQDKANRKTEKLLAETREALEEQVADQQTDLLLTKADLLAQRYFDALPEEYTDQDKGVISKLLTDEVKWEAIEENNDVLNDEVASGFERALKEFGQPRGSVAEKTEEKTESTTEAEETPKDEVPEYLAKDWGEMKEVKLPDGTVLKEQVHSDDDWKEALAAAIRAGRV
jgi:hypothetical protein